MDITPKEQMEQLYKVLSEKQGQDVTVIDIGGISDLADYFLITHGNNAPHVDALVDAAEECMAKLGVPCRSREGLRGGSGEETYLVSGDPEAFAASAGLLLGRSIAGKVRGVPVMRIAL